MVLQPQQQEIRVATRLDDMSQEARTEWQKWYNVAQIALMRCMLLRRLIHSEIEFVTNGHAQIVGMVEDGTLRLASENQMDQAKTEAEQLTCKKSTSR